MITLPPSERKHDQIIGFLIVAMTMIEMFTIPRSYFVLGSIMSTSAMICVSYLLLNGNRELFRPSVRHLVYAVLIAVLLYFIFFAGNLGIKAFPLFGNLDFERAKHLRIVQQCSFTPLGDCFCS